MLDRLTPELVAWLEAEIERRVHNQLQALSSQHEALKKDLVERERTLRERQQADSTLQENQHFIQQILETTPNLLTLYELDTGQIVFVNRQVSEILGYAAHEVRNMSTDEMAKLIYTDDLSKLTLALQCIAELCEGKVVDLEYRVRHSSGDWRWLRTRHTVFDRHDDGRPKRILGTSTDITDWKLAEINLEQARLQAEQENRSKSNFLATMSHEIRTPMNAVLGMANLLRGTELSPPQQDCVDTICASGETLLSIIDDILDFSKIDAGQLDLAQVPFNLRHCIESALCLVAAKAAEKNLDLVYFINTDVPDIIVGDAMRVQQVLMNLLSNAVKFTPSGEVTVNVSARTLRAEVAGEPRLTYSIRCSVRDTGVGIPSDRMNRLFQPFCQVDSSISRTYGGTGLGLVISQRLSELMGGRIWVESEEGVGSTFHFCMMTQAIASETVSTHQALGCLVSKRLLIVDNHSLRRASLALQVKQWGMVPCGVSSGEEARTWLQCYPHFDGVMIDHQLADETGLSLAAHIRQLPGGQLLPLVLLMPYNSGLYEAAPSGVTRFLSKPVRQSQLQQVLLDLFAEQDHPMADETPEAPSSMQEVATPTLSILVAEDNLVNQKVILRLLERLGYTADVVANGQEVLAQLRRQSYDVVLMDVQMPIMDGMTAAAIIRQEWSDDVRPRLIAVTANAMQGDRDECLNVGMDDYLSKPIRLEKLEKALQASISQRSRTQQFSPNPSIIDLNVLATFKEDLGDEAETIFVEMVVCYLEETPTLIREVEKALHSKNAEAMTRLTHTLKSSSTVVGAVQLANLCKQIERYVKDMFTAEGVARIEQLVTYYQSVAQALQHLLDWLQDGQPISEFGKSGLKNTKTDSSH
ncbi:response regulator [Leptolyngbya sp. AN02str]|uniref:PAS domain-containing hybrid sensor histidine kinase/response regulator n=1 Tax=Leptolyngbya sp. AN02str TaxID=3423363 RepID=UPI003D31B01A